MYKQTKIDTAFLASLFTATISLTPPSVVDAQDKTVQISKDSILGVAYIDSKHESRDVFFEEYFPQVLLS